MWSQWCLLQRGSTVSITHAQYLYRVEYGALNVFDELDVVDRGNENGRSGEEEQKHKQHCRGKVGKGT